MRDKAYDEMRERFIRGEALKWVLKLFDAGAFKHPHGVIFDEDECQFGVDEAKKLGWLTTDGAFTLLTRDGIYVGAKLAALRCDWLLQMADIIQLDNEQGG
jgi:hypothetical protein